MKTNVCYQKNNIEDIKKELLKTYTITSDGKCINNKTGKEVKFNKDCKGYLKARLNCPLYSNNKDKRKSFRLHRLMAMFFIKDFSDTLQVNHINGIKTDNKLENLEMVTNSQNAWHSWNILDSTSRRLKLINSNKKLCHKN